MLAHNIQVVDDLDCFANFELAFACSPNESPFALTTVVEAQAPQIVAAEAPDTLEYHIWQWYMVQRAPDTDFIEPAVETLQLH